MRRRASATPIPKACPLYRTGAFARFAQSRAIVSVSRRCRDCCRRGASSPGGETTGGSAGGLRAWRSCVTRVVSDGCRGRVIRKCTSLFRPRSARGRYCPAHGSGISDRGARSRRRYDGNRARRSGCFCLVSAVPAGTAGTRAGIGHCQARSRDCRRESHACGG